MGHADPYLEETIALLGSSTYERIRQVNLPTCQLCHRRLCNSVLLFWLVIHKEQYFSLLNDLLDDDDVSSASCNTTVESMDMAPEGEECDKVTDLPNAVSSTPHHGKEKAAASSSTVSASDALDLSSSFTEIALISPVKSATSGAGNRRTRRSLQEAEGFAWGIPVRNRLLH